MKKINWNKDCWNLRGYSSRNEFLEVSRFRNDQLRFGGNRLTVLERDGHKCRSCGISDDASRLKYKLPLGVDHIDGHNYKSKTPHHQMTNLQTLCQSCHSKKDSQRRDAHKKLLPEIVRAIRWKYAAGNCTHRSLATQYRIKHTTVYQIIHRQIWKHLDPETMER